jgi:hypothetical protein
VERFVERLFENWDKLQRPPNHKKWRDVNLAATVPGWTRFSVADEMLKRTANAQVTSPNSLKREFGAFLSQNRDSAQPQNNAERQDDLFRQFMIWRQKYGDAAQ